MHPIPHKSNTVTLKREELPAAATKPKIVIRLSHNGPAPAGYVQSRADYISLFNSVHGEEGEKLQLLLRQDFDNKVPFNTNKANDAIALSKGFITKDALLKFNQTWNTPGQKNLLPQTTSTIQVSATNRFLPENAPIQSVSNKTQKNTIPSENAVHLFSISDFEKKSQLLTQEISRYLAKDSNSKYYFQHLINPSLIGVSDKNMGIPGINRTAIANNKKTVVVGDGDGSTVRMLLAGVNSGIISFNNSREAMILIAELMDAEARVLDAINDPSCEDAGPHFQKFQEDKVLQGKLEALFSCLHFEPGHTLCISLGDGAHDRFSLNKDIDRLIREKMHACGAIFIRGNHDVHFRHHTRHPVYGGFAKDSASAVQWKKHEETVFVNAYYHKETNTLYTHHGIQTDNSNPNNLITAFGSYKIIGSFDANDFVYKINLQRPLYSPDDGDGFDNFTEFRPKEKQMSEKGKELGVIFVHGHNGIMDASLNNVIALNARSDASPYLIAAAIIGKVDKQ